MANFAQTSHSSFGQRVHLIQEANEKGNSQAINISLTDFPEGGQLLPAGDQGTGAADAVALARHLHVADDRLEHVDEHVEHVDELVEHVDEHVN